MRTAQEKEELSRMRDYIAERMHYYDEQVEYGRMSFEDKQHALAHEFGSDYQETLASINRILHEKPRTHSLVPHKHLTFLIALVAVALAASLFISAIDPSLTGHTINTQLVVSENVPVQLAWEEDTEILAVTATHSGEEDAELIVQDARGSHVLLVAEQGVVSCVRCPLTVSAPVLFEVSGQGEFLITSLTTRQKP